MLRRDLAIIFRGRTTWIFAALASLLIGHGFVKSFDGTGTLPAQQRLLDPMLFGLYVAMSLFGPVVSARGLSVEKQRRTFHALLLQSGSIARLVLSKGLAGTCGVLLPWTAIVVLVAVGHGSLEWTDLTDLAVPLFGYVTYAGYVALFGTFAASFTPSLRGAALLALIGIGGNLATDMSSTEPMFAWLQSNAVFSPGTYLRVFEQGKLGLGALSWMVMALVTLFAWSGSGCRFDLHGWRRWRHFFGVSAICGTALLFLAEVPASWQVVRPESASRMAVQAQRPRASLTGPRRHVVLAVSYGALPSAFLMLGLGVFATKARR